jgi:hypothetical protein
VFFHWKDHDGQEGGALGFSKNQQQLNPKQEPNITQQLVIREYFLEIQQY